MSAAPLQIWSLGGVVLLALSTVAAILVPRAVAEAERAGTACHDCVYIYIYIHVHIYVHIYICIYIYVHIYLYIYRYIDI